VDIVIKVRRIDVAAVASIIAHILIFAIPVREKPPGSVATIATPPMNVTIVPPEEAPPPTSVLPPPPKVAETAPPKPRPVERPVPRIVPPAQTAPPRAEPQPTPTPAPEPPPAQVDMLAAINQRRAQRRAAEQAAREGTRGPTEDERAMANINRNLASPGEGVSGVFQILSKGTRRAEFAFNGWRSDQRRWREVIEVDAGLGGDVDRAIVKRMIELIRTHYSGDFNWESHRLGRVVTLSARPEDNEGLEDFLIREFFGTPVVRSEAGGRR
jgi:hypothetical protein